MIYDALPNADVSASGELSRQCLQLGMATFHNVCDFGWKLPYGRTSDKANWHLILSEKMETCSTKHALLKALADELSLDVNLVLGIYAMKASQYTGSWTRFVEIQH